MRHWYLPDHRLVVTRIEGRASASEIREFTRQLSQEAGITGVVDVLQEQRSGRIPLNYGQLRALAEYWESVRQQQVRRYAVLVGDPAAFGITRMAHAVFHPYGLELRPFYELASAMSWLEIPSGLMLPPEIAP